MSLLEYENQIFLDAFHDDGLLVTARGLGLERIFRSFLKVYSDAGNLVLVLNTNQQDEDYFIEQLDEEKCRPLPKAITSEYSVKDREATYLEGGVLFITSRILVVDMLTNRIPIHLISGILIYKAHRILDSGQEAFILRLYREKNKTGFIKAFSNSPTSFTAGFCHVERVMKCLFVRKLYLWPRFQASVVSCLDKNKVDVIELHLQMTPAMLACQTALLDLIDACIKELKRRNPSLDTEEMTVENSLGHDLDQIIRLHLDPIWHQLGSNTRQLISDIKTLRLLLQYLTQYDCVNFYNLVNSLRTNEKAFGSNAGWLFMDAADSLFLHAKERLYQKEKKKTNSKDTAPKSELLSSPFLLEECPKWQTLKEVVEEIEGYHLTKDEEGFGQGRVLIAAADDKMCSQLREVLCDGGQVMLKRLYDKFINKTKEQNEVKAKNSWGKKQQTKSQSLTLTQMIKPTADDGNNVENRIKATNDYSIFNSTDTAASASAGVSISSSAHYPVLSAPITILHPLQGHNDPFGLIRTLEELQPTYVILYDADVTFVRQLEVFRASHPDKPLRVYFLMYKGSTEEQRYLTSLRREKEAFEYLIRSKATMVIPEEREGRIEDDPNLSRDTTHANATVDSRKGGGPEEKPQQQKIIVDMREFRSELPSLIHRRGIDIEPVTISVGDYILTPQICVERKSLSDLIGSLNNGRLYNQCVSMCRYYERPVLLIEFDPNKSFALQGKYTVSSEINSSDTTSRLTLLTLHFPRLRVLWCQGPYATAELFHKLKVGREQPDTSKAMSFTGDGESELAIGKYNISAQTMLLKMPGITTKNVHRLLNHVHNICDLVQCSVEKLAGILENEPLARQLHRFLHAEHLTANSSATAAAVKSKTAKYLDFKGSKRKRTN
ncbi:hypothetical protein CAPTEDRAFT_178005 [Capitella teleta]|uniref:DNA repair endonuclease XPF n=1 Tax=Capitella teleta TaxID=283909 RepID=R7TEW3_CAPTE|nr:hypothetical protein CAPTEDRAFT_178005 [Capitella teleta]|eukprot:ELT90017.1 hypothetical protein CAPTEDRAFT_178005 [Capitella teleta]